MVNLKVITCISDAASPRYRRHLRASCRHHQIELVTLTFNGGWTTHRIKDHLLRLFARRLPEETLLLFSDGYDTACLVSEDEIIARYKRFAKPLVFAAMRDSLPCEELAEAYPLAPTLSRYLSAGGFIGPAGYIVEMLEKYGRESLSHEVSASLAECVHDTRSTVGDLDAEYAWSNQFTWALAFLSNQASIALDYEAKLFLTLHHAARRQNHDTAATKAAETLSGGVVHAGIDVKDSEQTRHAGPVEEGLPYEPMVNVPGHVQMGRDGVRRRVGGSELSDLMPWLRGPAD